MIHRVRVRVYLSLYLSYVGVSRHYECSQTVSMSARGATQRLSPPITRSMACSKCFWLMASDRWRAAISAASLQTFAMSAPDKTQPIRWQHRPNGWRQQETGNCKPQRHNRRKKTQLDGKENKLHEQPASQYFVLILVLVILLIFW